MLRLPPNSTCTKILFPYATFFRFPGVGFVALLGLGVLVPGIASGPVGGAPERGAGAAIGTALGAGGIMYLGGTGAIGAARGLAAAGLGAVRAGTAMGSAASTAYTLRQEASGSSGIGSGLRGIARRSAAHRVGDECVQAC